MLSERLGRDVTVGSGRFWQEIFSPSGHRCQEEES